MLTRGKGDTGKLLKLLPPGKGEEGRVGEGGAPGLCQRPGRVWPPPAPGVSPPENF